MPASRRCCRGSPERGRGSPPYAFTTLEPNLGIVDLDGERRFVVADLPGLIEGAHAGRGLGLEFLRHVERTRVLAFLVESAAEDPAAQLAMVERELGEYSTKLLTKPRIVVLTKADLLPPIGATEGPALWECRTRGSSAHSPDSESTRCWNPCGRWWRRR